jgi:hypothetical protein
MAVIGKKRTSNQTAMTVLKRVWELEAWSPPGLQLDPEFGKTVLAPEMWKAGIPSDVFLGLSEIPSPVDCENLERDIETGVTSVEYFDRFCASLALPSSMRDPVAAARFLEYLHGRVLAWVHIPDDDAAMPLAGKIDGLLSSKGFRLRNSRTRTPALGPK